MLEIKKLHRPVNVTGLWGALDDIYLPGYYFPGEFHDFWEIVFVRSGSMTATGDGRVYRLSTGDAVFHKPMEFHTVRIDESGTRLVRISFSAVGIGMKRFEDRMATLRDDEIGLFLIVAKKFAAAMKCHNEGDMAGFETAGNSGAVMLETLLLLLSGRPDGTNRDLSQDEKRWLDIVSVMKDNIGEMLSVPELAARCMRVSVYARVSPAHKLRIVRAYKAAGQVVAMTGDGVIGQCHLASRRRAMYRMHASKGYSKAGGRIQSTLRLSARTTVSGMVSPTGIEPAA